MPVRTRKSTAPPLGPISGVVPKKVAFPHLVGRVQLLEQRLSTLPSGMYLVPATSERIWLAKRTDNGIVDITEYRTFADPEALLNVGIGDEELRNLIASRLEQPALQDAHHSLTLPTNLAQWRIANMPSHGVAVRPRVNRSFFFSIAARHPTYFDLAATFTGNVTVHYDSRRQRNWWHSGDVNVQFRGEERGSGAGANFLLHALAATVAPTEQATVWVSGYQQTALRRFAENRPTVFLLDMENETLYYVPVRLDQATAGNHTSCAVVTLRPTGNAGEVQCTPVEGCYGGGDVNRVPQQMLHTAASIRF